MANVIIHAGLVDPDFVRIIPLALMVLASAKVSGFKDFCHQLMTRARVNNHGCACYDDCVLSG